MWRALPLLGLLVGCGGLYSRYPDGGLINNNGLGPPLCMRTLADAISLPTPTGADAFQRIEALAFDKDHHLYVLSRSPTDESFVAVLGEDFKVIRTFGRGTIGPTRDMVVATNGIAYVVEDFDSSSMPPQVKRFDADGTSLGSWPANSSTQDDGNALAFDGEGLLNIAGLGHIYRYQPSGVFVDRYAVSGKGTGQLLFPTSLSFDPTTNSMWVADLFQNFVEKYTPGSDPQLAQFGGRGVADGKFDADLTGDTYWGPNRVAVDREGKIYANDPFASRLMKFSANGAFLGQFSFGSSMQVGPIAIDPKNGVLYVGRGATIDAVCPF